MLRLALLALLLCSCSAHLSRERYVMITPSVVIVEGTEPDDLLEPDEGYLYTGWLWWGIEVKLK